MSLYDQIRARLRPKRGQLVAVSTAGGDTPVAHEPLDFCDCACTCLNCTARRAYCERRRDTEPLELHPPLAIPIYADETISPGRFIQRQHRPMTAEQRRAAIEALRGRIVESTYGA